MTGRIRRQVTRFLKALSAYSGVFVLGAVVLLSGASSRACWAQEYHDKVVIILDASGSMGEEMGPQHTQKLLAAKSALKEVLAGIPDTTHVGLLVFSGKNVPNRWLYPLGPRDNEALSKAIDRPQPKGNTPLGEFIKIGADKLLEERAKQFGYGTYRLLIVTDGEATDGALTDRYTPQVLARGITIDVIGVNMKKDHTLATKVHSYRRADDPEALKQALTEILAEVSTTGSDAASAEAFDMLAPLPAELCASMLEALSHANNAPIGEQATVAAVPPANQGNARVPSPPAPPAGPTGKQKSSPTVMWIVVVVVFIVVLRVARRTSRR